jgi:hypothetical protein
VRPNIFSPAFSLTPYPSVASAHNTPSCAELAKEKPEQFKIVLVLDKPSSNWKGETGYITSDLVKKELKEFNTGSDQGEKVKVFVCTSSFSFFSKKNGEIDETSTT